MKHITQADLGISTMWNFRKARSGRELIEQLMALGFTAAELNYQVRPEWLDEIESIIRGGTFRVLSIHNVFPKTFDERFNTDSVLLGYPDEALRHQAVELAKTSIEWACRLGAGAVVFHPTEVPLSLERFDVPLKKLVAAHQTHTEEYRALRMQMLRERDASVYQSQVLRSLDELAEHVERHHLPVKLGMENRAMCHQWPLYSEFEPIVQRFAGSCIGVWLDTGHGIMMEEMGLQSLPLPRYVADCIVGMHIHDAKDALDHYAPYTLDEPVLEPFLPYIVQSPIKILELSGRLSAEEIRTGTARFVARYNRYVAEDASSR